MEERKVKKIVLVIVLTISGFLLSQVKVNASELYSEKTYLDAFYREEYYAKAYGLSAYFYEGDTYYTPSLLKRSIYFPQRYKKLKVYRHRKANGVITIASWQQEQITPWVDFVPGASISSTIGQSISFSTTISVTGGFEVDLIKEILSVSFSATLETTYGEEFHREHGIVADYNFARNVLGEDISYTNYAIAFNQAMGKYSTLNYEGKQVSHGFNIFKSAETAIQEWKFVAKTSLVVPLEGMEDFNI